MLKPELPWERKGIEAPSLIKRGDTLYLFYGGGYNNDRGRTWFPSWVTIGWSGDSPRIISN